MNCDNDILLSQATFRVIDIETTGLDPSADGVCELAYVDLDSSLQRCGLFSSLVHPGRPIPPMASSIHHIVDADIMHAPGLDQVMPAVLAPVMVAHNAEFERSFLTTEASVHWICTNRLALHLWPELERHGNQFLRYALELDPPIARTDPVHRALTDAQVTASLFARGLPLALQRWPNVATVGQLIDRIQAPALLHRVPFQSSNYIPFKDADYGLLSWIVERQAGGPDCVYTARQWLADIDHDDAWGMGVR